MKTKKTVGECVLDFFIYLIATVAVIITLYPLIYVFSASISSAEYLVRNEVLFLPKGFSLTSYRIILNDSSVWRSYYNTLWYTVVGTVTSVFVTMLAAYPLSRKNFFARDFFMFLFVVTMFFSGGLIPSYLLIVNLGLYNSRWALIIPMLISTWNLVVARTYIQTNIPDELIESVHMDRGGEFTVLFRFVYPLSKPIIATISLFVAVSHWNSFFPALLYLSDLNLHPLQLLLRRLLLLSSTQMMRDAGMAAMQIGATEMTKYFQQIRYAAIVVSLLPILAAYPFAQKYFIKGVMVGSLKG